MEMAENQPNPGTAAWGALPPRASHQEGVSELPTGSAGLWPFPKA